MTADTLPRFSFGQLAASVVRPPPEIAFPVRFAACIGTAIWLSRHPALIENESKWILITVLMVAQPSTAGSLVKGILRIVGTLAAGVAGIVLFGLFAQDPPLLLAGLLAVMAVGAYGFSGSQNQYAWFCFAFTTAIILGDAQGGGESVETVAFQRVTMVALGIAIVFLGDLLLWPSRVVVGVRRALSRQARGIGEAFRNAIDPASAGSPQPLVSELAGLLGQIAVARAEVGVSARDVGVFRGLAILLETANARIRALRSRDGAAAAARERGADLEAFAIEIAGGFGTLADALDAGAFAAEHLSRLDTCLARAEAHLAALSGTTELGPSRLGALGDVVGLLASLRRYFAAMLAGDEPQKEAEPSSVRPFSVWPTPDPFRMQIALRTAVAVGVALLVPMALAWPTDPTVVPIAIMVASIPTRGGALKTIALLLGVVAGGWALADAAIVFGGPLFGRMPGALAPAIVLALALGWLTAKRPELELMRTIGLLLALLPVFGGSAPPTDVYGSYSTTCYFALAIAIGWAFTQLMWPATAATLFRKRSADQLELCAALAEQLQSPADPAALRREIGGAFEQYASRLAGVSTLHTQAELEPVEASLDGPRRAALLALTQDLFDGCLSARRLGPEEAEALVDSLRAAAEQLRAGVATRPDAQAAKGSGTAGAPGLDGWIRDWQASTTSPA